MEYIRTWEWANMASTANLSNNLTAIQLSLSEAGGDPASLCLSCNHADGCAACAVLGTTWSVVVSDGSEG